MHHRFVNVARDVLIIFFHPISRLYRVSFYYYSKLSITWILKKSLLLIEAKARPLVIPRPFSSSAALDDGIDASMHLCSLPRYLFHAISTAFPYFYLRLIYTLCLEDRSSSHVAASINQPYGRLSKILIKRSWIARGGGEGMKKRKNMAKYCLENARISIDRDGGDDKGPRG